MMRRKSKAVRWTKNERECEEGRPERTIEDSQWEGERDRDRMRWNGCVCEREMECVCVREREME